MKHITTLLFTTLALILPALTPGARAQATAAFTVLHTFTGTGPSGSGTEGTDPVAGLIQGSDGNFYGTTETGGRDRYGTVFQITPAGVVTTLYGFTGEGTDGAYPDASLIQGSDGNFYGTTVQGGSRDFGGAVFQITPAGTLTVLHGFTFTDGKSPASNLTLGSGGNFFGTTSAGGSDDSGTVYQITPAGAFTSLHSFTSTGTDGANPEASLIDGRDGNFYGTTVSGGGSHDDGTVFEITATGVLTTLHSFTGPDGAKPLAALAQGSDGNFYGTTFDGGSGKDGTVYRITAAGAFTTVHVFTGSGPDGARPAAALVQGSDGNFYGTTEFGGTNGTGTIFQLTPAGVFTTLHSFSAADNRGVNADGTEPLGGLVEGRDGFLYGTTSGGGSTEFGTVFRLDVRPTLTSATKATGEVGEAFSYQIAGSNSPTGFGASGLPAGLSVNAATGVVSGTPQSAGTYTVTLTATNSSGQGAGTLTLTVEGTQSQPFITSAATATGALTKAFAYQITATGRPTSYGVQGLPGGLTINAGTGLVSGTPKFMGTYPLTLNAYNAYGKGSATLTLTIQAAGPPVITSASSASSTLGQAFSYQITASGSPTSFGVQGLPGALTVNASTGAVTGTPKFAGTFTLTLNAYNSAGKGSETLTLTVASD